jgi:phosphohistidine phosphatase
MAQQSQTHNTSPTRVPTAMKHIYILRHCEYDERSGPGPNFDCHLSAAGHAHAQRIGKNMRAQNMQPDLIYCSSAQRTRETLSALLENITAPEIIFDDEIFGCMPADLLSLLTETDDKYKTILIIGHNPGIHGIVHLLGQYSDDSYIKEIAYYYGAGMLCDFANSADNWAETSPENCRIEALYAED